MRQGVRLLHYLNEESLEGLEKVDQKPLHWGARWVIEYEVSRRKWQRIPDVRNGKGDVVEGGLATDKLFEPRLWLRNDEFDHRKPVREGNSTVKRSYRPPD